MDFDDNPSDWHSWYDEELEQEIQELCNQLLIPFHMRSCPAIKYLKGLKDK